MLHSIEHPEYFEVRGDRDGESCFGCDQEWYNSEWQRISGCGPTAASNIVYYISRTKPDTCRLDIRNNKAGCLALMEELWAYVTPTEEGIDTTKRFVDALSPYFDAVGLRAAPEICDIPEDSPARPGLGDVLVFLARALDDDAPVAFLNLCNGEENGLEAWHWVTVIALEYDDSKETVYLKILDESQIKKISLKRWYDTTTLGGGFVFFNISTAPPRL